MSEAPRNLIVWYDGSHFGGLEKHMELVLKHIDRERYVPHVAIPGRLEPVLSDAFRDVLRDARVGVTMMPAERGSRAAVAKSFLETVRMLRSMGGDAAFVQTTTAIGLRRDLLALRAAGLPIVRMLHFPASAMIDTRNQPWSGRGVRLLNRLVSKNIVLSEEDRRGLQEKFGVPDRTVEICPQGHDLEALRPRFSPREARQAVGLNAELPTVGLVGRLTEQKGHRYLIEAAASIRERVGAVQFVLVGAGGLEAELRAQVESSGVKDCFVFAGFQRDVRSWIEAADVMVMPSLFESAPMVLIECLALERPTVVSDLACFRANADASACRFVPVRDSRALGDAVVGLLQNPEQASLLAKHGAAAVRARFDVKSHMAKIMQTVDQVLTSRRNAR